MAEPLLDISAAPAETTTPPHARVDRERLLAAMVTLCETGYGHTTPEAVALIDSVFMDLVKRAERDIRLRLADQLASAPWAPSGLINALALDDIEIARPVIAKSPVLQDHDLIRILTMATIEHQIEVASRPDITADVVKAILDKGDPVVMTTLVGNETADMSGTAMARLVANARNIVALRAPLSRHPQLNTELACALYGWVSDTLKSEIVSRFKVDGAALDAALAQATAYSLAGAPGPQWKACANQEHNREDTETRLIAKLDAAGQLRPGFLLRSLREGKLHLFQIALASLASVKTEEIKAASSSSRPELLALACASIGIDRSVFPSIVSLVRALNDAKPKASEGSHIRVQAAFTLPPEEAIQAFRAGVAGLR